MDSKIRQKRDRIEENDTQETDDYADMKLNEDNFVFCLKRCQKRELTTII